MNETIVIGALAGIAVLLLRMRFSSLERRLDRLSRIDAKLDALMKAGGVTFDAFQDVPPGVREALEQGQTILAVKRLREATGLDLKQAKDMVDEIRRRRPAAIEPR